MSQQKNKQNRRQNKGHKGHKKGKKSGGDKVKARLQRMIAKTVSLKEKKNHELDLLNQQQKQLEDLLKKADDLNDQQIKLEIKNIIKSYKVKRQRKLRKKHNKKNGKKYNDEQESEDDEQKNDDYKNGKKDKKNHKKNKKEEKEKRKQEKFEKKKEKEANKAEKLRKKEERKKAKEERKRIKQQKAESLDAARLSFLPSNKKEIGNKKVLNVYVDGYNIVGCDSLCRKGMRGRGGMGKSRKRMAKLLQENFLDKIKRNELDFPYDIIVHLWFDGGSTKQNHKFGDIQVSFSTKKQIVDDKLVEQFGQSKFNENANILVVTTDKELTLRLYEIGVKVIKSSTFYKTYLKENEKEKEKEQDEQKQDIEQEKEKEKEKDEENDAVLVKFCSQKMHSHDDDTPDEMDEDDEQFIMFDNDHDFDETFGEESDEITIE